MKKIISWVLVVFMLAALFDHAVFAEDSAGDLEAEESTERSVDFNGGWSFKLGDVSGAQNRDYDDESWRKLTLPHDWSIEQDFTHNVSSEIGHLSGGTGWYRKAFVLPETYKNKRVSVRFGGVYMDSYIYLNGELIGNYPYGYLPFSSDLRWQNEEHSCRESYEYHGSGTAYRKMVRRQRYLPRRFFNCYGAGACIRIWNRNHHAGY